LLCHGTALLQKPLREMVNQMMKTADGGMRGIAKAAVLTEIEHRKFAWAVTKILHWLSGIFFLRGETGRKLPLIQEAADSWSSCAERCEIFVASDEL
jgi:hypothetical protein